MSAGDICCFVTCFAISFLLLTIGFFCGYNETPVIQNSVVITGVDDINNTGDSCTYSTNIRMNIYMPVGMYTIGDTLFVGKDK